MPLTGPTASKTIRVLDPTADSDTATHVLAKRPATLDGKVVGILDNHKPNFDLLAQDLSGMLQERFAGIEVKRFNKPTASLPATSELIAEALNACDAVITGSGD